MGGTERDDVGVVGGSDQAVHPAGVGALQVGRPGRQVPNAGSAVCGARHRKPTSTLALRDILKEPPEGRRAEGGGRGEQIAIFAGSEVARAAA